MGLSELDQRELQPMREWRRVTACGQAKRVARVTEGRGHTFCGGSALLCSLRTGSERMGRTRLPGRTGNRYTASGSASASGR